MSELLGIILLLTAGYYFGGFEFEQTLIQDCRTKHNVHNCEVVAVPSKPTPTNKEDL